MDLKEIESRYESLDKKFTMEDDEGVLISWGELRELIRLAKMAPIKWESRLENPLPPPGHL